MSNKSLFEFKARFVFYAVGFVGEINHLKTFTTFLAGPSMSVVQGLATTARQRPSCPPRDGAPPPSDLRGEAAPVKKRRIRA